jgi:uncharacterized NAD-dependent epimerase/dehydratase family protein
MTPLTRNHKLALYMEDALTTHSGKLGFGVLRYSPNEVACVIDSKHAGQNVADILDIPRRAPVVANIEEAIAAGADVFVLGIAPPGGLIPAEWYADIDHAVDKGMSVVNGLHDLLAPRYPNLNVGQFIWDIRIEPEGLSPATGAAAKLDNRRVLMIGTDMAIGKMTAGLEIHQAALNRGIEAEFVATGQIGILLTGAGVPLDAVRVDFAGGSIEREVMRYADAELVIVEGQGSLIHPGSTATLPLLRGSMPTHLILCHRAGQDTLLRLPDIKIPPLRDFIELYEDLAEACGSFPRPKTIGVALNTSHLEESAAMDAIVSIQSATGLPVTDPVRFGAGSLLDALMA